MPGGPDSSGVRDGVQKQHASEWIFTGIPSRRRVDGALTLGTAHVDFVCALQGPDARGVGVHDRAISNAAMLALWLPLQWHAAARGASSASQDDSRRAATPVASGTRRPDRHSHSNRSLPYQTRVCLGWRCCAGNLGWGLARERSTDRCVCSGEPNSHSRGSGCVSLWSWHGNSPQAGCQPDAVAM